MKHGHGVVRWVSSSLKLSAGLVLISILSSCGGYPKPLDVGFSRGGEALNTPTAEFNPNISSDYVAFISDRDESQDVYLYQISEQKVIDLPKPNALDMMASDPTVSEDGQSIAFTGTRRGQSDIYLYNRETESLRILTQNLSAQVRNPTISADGSTIAFEANPDGQWDIKIYNRSGKPVDVP